jgi:hypothetical protein
LAPENGSRILRFILLVHMPTKARRLPRRASDPFLSTFATRVTFLAAG